MATTTIKLAKRMALLKLEQGTCIKLKDGRTFFTDPGIIEINGKECVQVPMIDDRIFVPIKDITHIQIVNRFNPDVIEMMEVDWK